MATRRKPQYSEDPQQEPGKSVQVKLTLDPATMEAIDAWGAANMDPAIWRSLPAATKIKAALAKFQDLTSQ